MGIYSNGLRSQQQPAEKVKKVDVPEKSSTGGEQPRADAPAATGVTGDAKTVQRTKSRTAYEALREIAAATPRRWPDD